MAVRTLREIALFAFFVLVAVVITWPLATNLPTAVSDLGDPLLNAWILDWDCYALTHQPLHLFDAPIFFPARLPLAYSEHLIGIALLSLPFYALGFSPLSIYNIALLLGFALSAYGASVLARVVTRGMMPAIIAGILYGFVPYRFSQLAHVQVISSGWLPLLLAALLVYRRSPSWRNAALFGAAFLMNGLTNIYFFLFGSIAMVLTIALIAIAETRDARFWSRMGLALTVAMALLLPFLVPYKVVAEQYGMKRGEGESLGASATWNDWLIAPRNSVLYGSLPPAAARESERQLFPGALMLLLTGAAFFSGAAQPSAARAVAGGGAPRWLDGIMVLLAILTYIGAVAEKDVPFLHFSRSYLPATLLVICIVIRLAIRFPRALGDGNLRMAIASSRFPFELWAAGLWIVVGVLGAFGMHAFFHSFLFHRAPGFRAIRVPARWAMVAYTGLAAWSSAGAAQLRGRRWVLPLMLALTFADVWPRIRWEHALAEPDAVDHWLAQTHAGPLVELPINRLNVLYLYLLRATTHHVPIFDGISGWEPPLHRVLREQPLTDSTLALLEKNGCRFVLVRPDWFGWETGAASAWLRRGLEEGRLVFLRRFDYGVYGDWLFALSRVEKQWQRFRAPQRVNAAGFTPDQELALMLDGKPTYSQSTFGQLYQPKHMSEITGPMTVSGWVESPRGIRTVTVRIDSGRFRFDAPLFAREDVSRLFPWYPQTPRPAFATVIARPPNVPEETDLQIEITDGSGGRTLLSDVLLRWK